MNKLTFFLKPNDCVLTLEPSGAIMLGIRLEFPSVAKFYESGGNTVFAHRMASILQIHFSDLRVVSVYTKEWSRRMLQEEEETTLVVEFEVSFPSDESRAEEYADEETFFEEVEGTFVDVMSTLTEFMGRPVLGASSSGQPVETPFDVTRRVDGNDVYDFGLDDGLRDDEHSVREEPGVITEIRYGETITVGGQAHPAGTITYGMLLAAVSAVLAAGLISAWLYCKCRTKREPVVKEVAEPTPLEKVRAASGKVESVSLEQ